MAREGIALSVNKMFQYYVYYII